MYYVKIHDYNMLIKDLMKTYNFLNFLYFMEALLNS